MSGKIILYTIVLTLAASLGFLASYMLAGSPEQIARPVPLTARAEAAAANVETRGVNFTMPNLNGTESQLSDWAGKPRIINFWATWCAPCRREIPLLKAMQDAQAVPDLQVIGIAFDELEPVREYAEDAAFNYPILVGEQEASAAADAFGLELIGLPFTLVVSASGELVNAHSGEVDQSEADAIVATLGELESGAISLEQARQQLAN